MLDCLERYVDEQAYRFNEREIYNAPSVGYYSSLKTPSTVTPTYIIRNGTVGRNMITAKKCSRFSLFDYRVEDKSMRQEIQDFIDLNPQVGEELSRARPIIKQVFGRDDNLEIRLLQDPEYPTLKTLICYIHTDVDIVSAESNLKSFYDSFHNPTNGHPYTGGGIANHKLMIDLYLD